MTTKIKQLQTLALKAENDFVMWDIIKHLTKDELVDFFDDTELFFEDSDCEPLADAAKISLSMNPNEVRKQNMLKIASTIGYGVIFKNYQGTKFAIIHPSVENFPRVTFFDHRGFFAHSECADMEGCVLDAFHSCIDQHDPSISIDDIFGQKAA